MLPASLQVSVFLSGPCSSLSPSPNCAHVMAKGLIYIVLIGMFMNEGVEFIVGCTLVGSTRALRD